MAAGPDMLGFDLADIRQLRQTFERAAGLIWDPRRSSWPRPDREWVSGSRGAPAGWPDYEVRSAWLESERALGSAYLTLIGRRAFRADGVPSPLERVRSTLAGIARELPGRRSDDPAVVQAREQWTAAVNAWPWRLREALPPTDAQPEPRPACECGCGRPAAPRRRVSEACAQKASRRRRKKRGRELAKHKEKCDTL